MYMYIYTKVAFSLVFLVKQSGYIIASYLNGADSWARKT